ncbi:hypothetical protein C8J56DRAFT_1031459 [Mycena floridula]|nr:hypothetical protein C8J56DRAFT_1031459 [Mycena floridula]
MPPLLTVTRSSSAWAQMGLSKKATSLKQIVSLSPRSLTSSQRQQYVTIAGHPSEYLKRYSVGKTLEGHGIKVFTVNGKDIDALWGTISSIVTYDGPAAVIAKQKTGSSKETRANHVIFGEAVNLVLDGLSKKEAEKKVMVIDRFDRSQRDSPKIPEVFVPSDKFSVFLKFSAFLEMVVSELTMARLNNCNILCHFSHSGVDKWPTIPVISA